MRYRFFARWADGRKVIALLRAMPQLESLSLPEPGQLIDLALPGDFERVQRLLEEVLLLPVAASLRTLKLRNLFHKRHHEDMGFPGLLSADFLAALPARCPRLTSLDLSGCPELNDGLALALVPLPLRELRLSGNPQLTEGALQALLKRSSDALRVVDFSECANSRLAERDEFAVTPIAPSGWASLRIEELSLKGWTTPLQEFCLFTPAAGVMPSALAVLDLTNCNSLAFAECYPGALPALRKFIANSSGLGAVVLDGCPKLAHVQLSGCSRLHAIRLDGSHAIETLTLFGCRLVPEADVRRLLQNNGATLRELNLNGALNTVNIEEAEIRKLCPNLEELDAKGRARKY